MTQFQKATLGVISAVLVIFSWLANVFLHMFVEVDGELIPINPELQGIAIATIVLVIGISTPIGSSIVAGAKKVGKNVAKAFK